MNPDLTKVKGISPHFWKLEDGKILPLTETEQKLRLLDIKNHGVDNEVKRLKNWQFNPSIMFSTLRHASTFVFFAASVLFCYAVVANYFPKLITWLNP